MAASRAARSPAARSLVRALLDSNIVIYLLDVQHAFLSERLSDMKFEISEISRLEVLGFPGLSQIMFSAYQSLLDRLVQHPLSSTTIKRAIDLRRQRKMSLGDALIGATALEHGLTLITRNSRDFQWISGLAILNPFDAA